MKSSPAKVTPAASSALRGYLYATAALAGAAIMVVQILGARMLSPFVGTSHFVWTAQIAITMVALALGYYAGGRLVDRTQKLGALYSAVAIAALYLSFTLRLVEPVAYWSLGFSLPVGTLLAAVILYFIPLALLAMIGPFLVRVMTSAVTNVGGTTGRLTAISTLGSFLGTIVIGYVMIPLLPNAHAMYLTAMVLFLLSAGSFLFSRSKGTAAVPLILAIGATIAVLPQLVYSHQFSWVKELYRGNSHFGTLQVLERHDGSCRYYLNDNLVQNTYAPDRKQSVSTFTYMLSGLARAYTTNIQDVLCIGMGIGIVPREFAQQGARVDVVEINPAIVPVARDFFDFQPDKVRIIINDGRHYLNRCEKQYDAVILDAFLGDSSPAHLMTREAFTAIRRVLRPGGVLVINSFTSPEKGEDFFGASLKKTLASVFPGVRLHSNSDGAIFFMATDRADPQFLRTPDLSVVHPEVRDSTARAFATLVDTSPEHGRVLTDDFNPVEFYDARNREQIRRRLAETSRKM